VVSCSGNPNTSGAKFKPNTFSSTVQADITDINASYHSLQTSVEKRMSHGFTVLANYTYSKSLDDLPFGEGVSGFDTGYSHFHLTLWAAISLTMDHRALTTRTSSPDPMYGILPG
jgi:hypothetical protein